MSMNRAKSAGFGNRNARNTPDHNDDTVSATSRRSAAVAGLFGDTSPEKSAEVNVSNLN
jgi:hypothetical protein